MRRSMSIALFALLVAGGAQAATRVLEPQDLFQMQWASDPQVRKDGALIAYVRTTNDIMSDRLLPSIWLIDVATGIQTPVATGPGEHSSPRWSPDGSRIAYRSTGADARTQILIHTLHGETASITNLVEAPEDISWSPDGKLIAFAMHVAQAGPTIGKPLVKPPGAQWGSDPLIIDSLNFRADGQGLENPGFKHLYVVSADGGAPRQLTSGPFSDAGPLAWSPDGKSIYFAGNRSEDWKREPQDWARHTAMTQSIYRLTVATGSLQELTHDIGPYHAPTVSPDGKRVAFLGYHDQHIGNQNVRLNLMNADGTNQRLIGESLDRSLEDCQWAADGQGLYVQYTDRGITKVARLGLDGRFAPAATALAELDSATQLPYSGGAFTVSGKGVVAYLGGDADDLPQVYLAHDGKTRKLTNLNSQLLQEVSLGQLSALPVKSSVDGRSIDAWELRPPNFDPNKKYPLILEIHGGPYASYGPVFAADYQLYAAAGYIVVYGNPRGSTSYGEEFANQIYNDYPSHDYDDLMSIVDAAIEAGGVDSEQLLVTGSSGGGVLSAWIVGKTHRFKAAVVQRPVVNWTSWMLNSDMSVFGARYWFKKMPWEDPDTYWKHSPLSLVGQVTTPTMVIVGLNDLRTTVQEAEQYHQALQMRNVPTELYEIPGASHILMRPSQLATQTTAIIEWFQRYQHAAHP